MRARHTWPWRICLINVGLGGDFAGDDDQAGGQKRLGGDAAVRVLLDAGVENSVGDLVRHLVRMAFGDALRGKQESVAQCKAPPIAGNSIWAVWSEDRFMLDHRRERRIFSRIGPTLAQSTPAPSGMRLGMHTIHFNCVQWPGTITRSEWGRERAELSCKPGEPRQADCVKWCRHGANDSLTGN